MMIPMMILTIENEDDREFMAQLFLDHVVLMKSIAHEIVQNKSDTDDLIQNALLALIDKIDILKNLDQNQRISYFANTLKNVNINQIIKKETKKRKQTPEAEAALYHVAFFTSGQSPEESFINTQRYQSLGRALKKLPEKERQVLISKFVFEMSHRQIADQLGLSTNSIYTYIARARKKLRKALEEEEESTHV